MHERKKVVIIGSGLGGLSCGVILQKNGYDVTVLEQSAQIGGCLQCFSRKGAKFETGMHFIGSAANGQTMDKLMRYLELSPDIRLSPLDADGYDVVNLNGREYRFASGKEAFIRQMCEYFPGQEANIRHYYDTVEMISNASSLHSLKYAERDNASATEYHLRSIDDVMQELVSDPTLAKVLVGNLPLYAAEKGKTPFSVHAFIMDFYNQSSFRIVGGSDNIARSLHHTIERYGGTVRNRSKVTRILCDDTRATAVEINGGEILPADFVISDAHPLRTLELLDTKMIRPAFRNRIKAIPQTVGSFSVYLKFKEGRVPYMNYNFYAYNQDTPWNCENYTEADWPKGFLYMHFCQEEHPQYATTGVILSYMRMDDVEKWQGTKVGRRGDDYEQFKHRKAERLLDELERFFPGLRENIEEYYTSTPLTYLDYTGTEGGSMYGIAKDVAKGAAYRVPHRTKVPNVLQTGQNINSHGMLGVLVGTIVTCSEFLPAKTIYEQIKACDTDEQ